MRVKDVKSATTIETNRATLVTKIVRKISISNNCDGNIIAFEIDRSTVNFLKVFFLVHLDPDLGLFIALREFNIAVEYCGTVASNHCEVAIFEESELLDLVACDVVGAPFLAVDVLE